MRAIGFAVLLLSATATGAQGQSTPVGTQSQAAPAATGQTSCGLACVVGDTNTAAASAAGPTKLPPNLAKLAENKSDLNRVVCEKQETLGSRLGAKKVCMTVAQWLEFENNVKDQTRRIEILGKISN
jgi:hypothetical protein